MQPLLHTLNALVSAMQVNMLFVLEILLIIWVINIVNWLVLGSRLNYLGILPRTVRGIIGIPISPWLHGHFNHLFFNSFPLFILANLVLLSGRPIFFCVTLIIIAVSGIIVWVIGRRAYHLGASGLIMGYWGFLLIQAVQERTIMALILGAVSLYYFGGLLLELFPDKAEVSWEGHLAGFIGGISALGLCHSPWVWRLLGY